MGHFIFEKSLKSSKKSVYFLELLCYNKITIKTKHISEKEKQNAKSQISLFNYRKGILYKENLPALFILFDTKNKKVIHVTIWLDCIMQTCC